MEEQAQNTISKKPKRTFWKFIFVFLGIMTFILVGYPLAKDAYFDYKANQTLKDYQEFERQYGTIVKSWDADKSFFAQVGGTVGNAVFLVDGFFTGLFDNDKQDLKFAGQVSLNEKENINLAPVGYALFNETKEKEQARHRVGVNIAEKTEDKKIIRIYREEQPVEIQSYKEEHIKIDNQDLDKKQEKEQQQEIPELILELIPELIYKKCSFVMGDEQTPSHKGVIINEVAWMGGSKTFNLKSSDEWIELKNTSNSDIDLSGWQVLDVDEQIKVIFGKQDKRAVINAKISANGFFLLERTDDDSVLDIIADFVYVGALSNNGKTRPEGLRLFNSQCDLIDEVLTGSNWPAGDNSQKRTMERSGDLSWHTYNGIVKNGIFGTPKAKNSQPLAVVFAGSSGGDENDRKGVVSSGGDGNTPINNPQPIISDQQQSLVKLFISEVQIRGNTVNDEFIELYNPNSEPINLTGWSIKKKTKSGKEYLLLASSRLDGKSISAKSYFLAVNEGGYQGEIIPDVGWAKSNTIAKNNTILLYDVNQNIIDKVGFGGAQDFETNPTSNPGSNQSISRQLETDTDNNAQDFILSNPTPKNSTFRDGFLTPAILVEDKQELVNQSPTAFFDFSPQSPEINQEIIFNAASSTDDGNIVLYNWDFGDGQNVATTQAVVVHSYSTAGDYLVKLVVFDDNNVSSTISLTIEVVSFAPIMLLTQSETNHIVISEIQVAGVDAGDEFIELYNPTEALIDVSNWSIQYVSGRVESVSALTVSKKNFVNGNALSANGFFLIARAKNSDGTNGYTGSVLPDMTHRSFSLSGALAGAKIFLVSNQEKIENENDSDIVDMVDYSFVVPKAFTSLERKAWQNGNCVSAQSEGEFLGNSCNNNNNNDFKIRQISNPQNSNSLPEPR